jgi:hypothetical protein
MKLSEVMLKCPCGSTFSYLEWEVDSRGLFCRDCECFKSSEDLEVVND